MSEKLQVVRRDETVPGCGLRGPEIFVFETAREVRAFYAVLPGSEGAFSGGLAGDSRERLALQRFADWFWSGNGRMPHGWRIARRKDLLTLLLEFMVLSLVSRADDDTGLDGGDTVR